MLLDRESPKRRFFSRMEVMKLTLLIIGIIVIIIGGVLIYPNLIKKEEISMPEKTLANKKIAMVIAFRDFQDIEYFIPRNILVGAGAQITTISSQKGLAIGADGGEVEVNLAVSEVQAGDFDVIVFIGGSGMGKKLDDESFQKIAKDAAESGKILGAICIAPILLAKAGVLQGKQATVWSSPMDKSAIKILEEEGAKYLAEEVVVDGKIVTALGPSVAKKFGEALIKVLTSN